MEMTITPLHAVRYASSEHVAHALLKEACELLTNAAVALRDLQDLFDEWPSGSATDVGPHEEQLASVTGAVGEALDGARRTMAQFSVHTAVVRRSPTPPAAQLFSAAHLDRVASTLRNVAAAERTALATRLGWSTVLSMLERTQVRMSDYAVTERVLGLVPGELISEEGAGL